MGDRDYSCSENMNSTEKAYHFHVGRDAVGDRDHNPADITLGNYHKPSIVVP